VGAGIRGGGAVILGVLFLVRRVGSRGGALRRRL